MNIFKTILFFSFLSLYSCQETREKSQNNNNSQTASLNFTEIENLNTTTNSKIKVLNMGTFHFGYTTDANTTDFNEHDKKNQKKAHDIAAKLAAFKPTVIIVERLPENNEELQKEYEQYLKNPEMKFENPSEEHLIAYEVGRLSGAKKIYGIDHKMGYNYNIGAQIDNSIDPEWYDLYFKDPKKFHPGANKDEEQLDLLDNLILHNEDAYLDFLISVNADMLTTAGTENNFEGADEAAKFYQRNLRMFSNLNRIDFNKDDRVFILMGAAHTAFFKNFMRTSPKYDMIDTFEYLK